MSTRASSSPLMTPSALLRDGEALHRALSAATTAAVVRVHSQSSARSSARLVSDARILIRQISSLLETHSDGGANDGGPGDASRPRNADLIQLRSLRTNLRKVLSQLSFQQIKEDRQAPGGGDDNAAALQSLLRTRAMMAAEVDKMNEAVAALESDASSVRSVNDKLMTLSESLSAAQQLVSQLVRVKTVEDIVLRLSVLLFLMAVIFVWYQRLFGRFVSVIYDVPP